MHLIRFGWIMFFVAVLYAPAERVESDRPK